MNYFEMVGELYIIFLGNRNFQSFIKGSIFIYKRDLKKIKVWKVEMICNVEEEGKR